MAKRTKKTGKNSTPKASTEAEHDKANDLDDQPKIVPVTFTPTWAKKSAEKSQHGEDDSNSKAPTVASITKSHKNSDELVSETETESELEPPEFPKPAAKANSAAKAKPVTKTSVKQDSEPEETAKNPKPAAKASTTPRQKPESDKAVNPKSDDVESRGPPKRKRSGGSDLDTKERDKRMRIEELKEAFQARPKKTNSGLFQ